jgi:Ser/Thr protein kinase RdoA (MazF antagonist)
MTFAPDATLDTSTQISIADAYGLGESVDAIFVARGAMGAVNRMGTSQHGAPRFWTVKRSYWNHYDEQNIAQEVEFTRRCESVGVPAPRSVQRVDGGGYVHTVGDHANVRTQYRVLEWVVGEVGRLATPQGIALLAEWMARIHTLGVDPAGYSIDPWFIRVAHDWDDLAGRLAV